MDKGWKFLLLLAVAPFGMMWSGYALTVLWGWFVIPVFGVAPIGIVNAIGLSTVLSYAMPTPTPQKDDRDFDEKFFAAIGIAIIKPLFALGFGWAVHSFA
jgi:hypothetical protein